MVKRIEKTISLGKVAYNGGRKINEATVTFGLVFKDNGQVVFTAMGDIWNMPHTDCVCGGQCLDEIFLLLPKHSEEFKKVYRWWKMYHLNDSHCGTIEQEHLVGKAIRDGLIQKDKWGSYYGGSEEYLKSIGFYEDGGQRYGEHHYWPIREQDLKEIKEMLGID